MTRPRRLRQGSRVALVAPAGPLPHGGIERAVQRVRDLGWEALVGEHAGSRVGYLAGPDERRLADLTAAFEGENDAIWCLRGGYGTMRIVEALDFDPLLTRPRPLIGFSDNTVLHLAAARAGITTFHGPHAGVAAFPVFTRECLIRSVEDARPTGVLPLPADHPRPQSVVPGVAEGSLIGGNLSLLAATIGTPYQISPRGGILFLEEVGEPAYRVDRLLTQLLLSGVLEGVAGIAVGAMSDCPDTDPEVPRPEEVVRDRLGRLGVPVACGFPFGHVPESWTLPIGVAARLDATEGTLEILTPAVEE